MASLFLEHFLVNEVEDSHELVLAHSVSGGVEAIEARVDAVDELVSRVAVLQATANTIGVHLGHEFLELVAAEETVGVGIAFGEGSVDLAHESLESFGVLLELLLEFGTLRPLIFSEGAFPLHLVSLQGGDKAGNSLSFGLLLDHLLFQLQTINQL